MVAFIQCVQVSALQARQEAERKIVDVEVRLGGRWVDLCSG